MKPTIIQTDTDTTVITADIGTAAMQRWADALEDIFRATEALANIDRTADRFAAVVSGADWFDSEWHVLAAAATVIGQVDHQGTPIVGDKDWTEIWDRLVAA